MNEISRRIVGSVIKEAVLTHGYLQLFFKDGSVLNIFNRYSLVGVDLRSLSGRRVENISEKRDHVTFSIERNAHLDIGLGDTDYTGPECMQYVARENVTIVW
jgi:hypothetical protein